MPVSGITPKETPSLAFNSYLLDGGSWLDVADFCQIKYDDGDLGTITCNHIDVTREDIVAHLNNGARVIKFAASWEDKISFVLDQNLVLRKLEFIGLESNAEDAESEHDVFMADFELMEGTFNRFVAALVDNLGAVE